MIFSKARLLLLSLVSSALLVSAAEQGCSGRSAPRTYSSDKNGFSLQYPRFSSIADGADVRTPAYLACEGGGEKLVKVFQPSRNANQISDYEVSVWKSTAAADNGQCGPDAQGRGQNGFPAVMKVGGLEFILHTASDAGMSHFADTTEYKAVHDGYCWQIQLCEYGSLAAPYKGTGRTVSNFSKKEAREVFEEVLRSFRFEENRRSR